MSTLSTRIYDRAHKVDERLHRSVGKGVPKLKAVALKPAIRKQSLIQTQQSVYYSTIFEQVYTKRLSYFRKVVGLLSFLVALVITIFSPDAKFIMVPLKTALIFGSFVFIESARELSIVVDYNTRFKTLWNQITGSLLSKKFLNTLVGFEIAGFIYFFILYCQMSDKSFTYYVTSPTRTIKLFINDEFIYYWFHSFFVALLYSIHHTILLRNKLKFKFGVARMNPKDTIFKNQLKYVKDTLFLTVASMILSPFVYSILRPLIYKVILYPVYWPLGLNHKMPLSKITFSMSIFLIIVDSILVHSWNLVNHVFNVYATVGCVVAGKNFSSLSKEPVNTLLSGLRDSKRPLVKLTAFQELANISTSEDFKQREFIYTSHFKNSYVWPSILEECSQVIEETCKRIKARPKVLKSKTNITTDTKPSIFGNSQSQSETKQDNKSSHYELKSAGLVSTQTSTHTSLPSLVNDNIEPIDVKKMVAPLLNVLLQYYRNFLNSGFGKPFRPTLRRDADSRVSNATNFGNAIISISYIALSAEFEDKKNVVISTLPEILELLEDAVTSTKNYIDNPPVEDLKIHEKNSIDVLHSLAMRLFFEIVVKYNHILNDFALTQPVFNLSKWCIDLAIEQQKEQELESSLNT